MGEFFEGQDPQAHRRAVTDYFRRRMALVYDYLEEHPCVDCGDTNILHLTFDHVRDKKYWNVSSMVYAGYSMDRVFKEIAKCEVVCCNCHAERTHKRAGDLRLERWLEKRPVRVQAIPQAPKRTTRKEWLASFSHDPTAIAQ